MDDEDISIGIAEAVGKATAAIAVQSALIGLLHKKRILTNDDVATLSGLADDVLRSIEGLSDDARVLSRSCLRGFAKTWTKLVTKN